MNKIIISPSILEYEPNLENSFEKIRKILSSGIEWIHIDIMRKPFIPDKNKFSEEALSELYNKFKDYVKFDFHLMVSEPDKLIEFLNNIVENKKDTMITIHIESYRKGLGKYDSKDYDLINKFKEINKKNVLLVYNKLKEIKDKGFKVGLALEPNTSLENIKEEMFDLLDMVLLMSVSSGSGGQKYTDNVTNKIKELREKHKKLMIQVDGGMNEETIPVVVKAGANNLVIGSYITRADEPVKQIKSILSS